MNAVDSETRLHQEIMVRLNRMVHSLRINHLHILPVLLLTLTTGSCSLFSRAPTYEELFELKLSSPTTAVRPGEAMLVDAKLKNTSGKTLGVRQLNADSLSFYWWSDNNPNRLYRKCIFSAKENLNMQAELHPDQILSRRFLFTTITHNEGVHYLQAMYRTPIKGKRESPMAVSPPLTYEVSGEPLFQRGDDGLILKEEAIRVAKEHLGRPTVSETAALIKNEAGFYDWWVTVTVAQEALAQGERPEKGYFVNPYLGIVRKEATPNLRLKPTVEQTTDAPISENYCSRYR